MKKGKAKKEKGNVKSKVTPLSVHYYLCYVSWDKTQMGKNTKWQKQNNKWESKKKLNCKN